MEWIKIAKSKQSNITETETIEFYRATGKYGFLSCLYKKTFLFENREFESAEHAYQFGKIKIHYDEKIDESIRDWIMNAPYPHLVAMICHNLPSWNIVEGWSKIRVNRMYRVLQAKFQDEELKQKLLDTGNAILIENSKTDSLWGIGKKRKGRNMLGKLLMKVREELRE